MDQTNGLIWSKPEEMNFVKVYSLHFLTIFCILVQCKLGDKFGFCIIGFSKIKPRFFMLKFFSIDGISILDPQSNRCTNCVERSVHVKLWFVKRVNYVGTFSFKQIPSPLRKEWKRKVTSQAIREHFTLCEISWWKKKSPFVEEKKYIFCSYFCNRISDNQ